MYRYNMIERSGRRKTPALRRPAAPPAPPWMRRVCIDTRVHGYTMSNQSGPARVPGYTMSKH